MAILRRAQRKDDREEPLFAFRQCPGCDYDFVTGAGTRACGWYDCPYLPEELKVTCPDCNYNFATGEGTPWCGDVPECRWAEEGRRHARNALRLWGQQRSPAAANGTESSAAGTSDPRIG